MFSHRLPGNHYYIHLGARRRLINGENIYTTSLSRRDVASPEGPCDDGRTDDTDDDTTHVAEDICLRLYAQLLVVFARSRQRKSIS